MSHIPSFVKSLINSGDSELTITGLKNISESEWTEDMVLELLPLLPQRFYETLFDCVPEHCITSNVWQTVYLIHPELVPTAITTQGFYEDAVRRNRNTLCKIPRRNRTTKLCLIAINNTEREDCSLLHIVPYESQTEEMILTSIMINCGNVLAAAAFQTPRICMLAVEYEPTSIMLVNDQTFAVCEKAIQVAAQRGENYVMRDVISSIREHTVEICIIILRYCGSVVLESLRNHQREVCLEAIRLATRSEVVIVLRDIRTQTLEVCLAAYRKDQNSYQVVRDIVIRRRLLRMVLVNMLIPLRGADLSTALLTEVCECLLIEKFPPMIWENPQLLTPTQLWKLAAKVKHAN
ncbi:MAG: hypothetical protein WC052_04470 [Patescibacteria group bacterium]